MENTKTTMGGYRLDAEIKNVPVAFVNALRRILLSEIPVVVLNRVEILENTTSLTHEMLRHRVEMLPINVRPDELAVVRDTQVELKISATESSREVTTDDFTVTGPRKDVLLRDRDLNTPMYFLNVKPGQALHIRASLSLEPRGSSQVCVSTFMNHVDEEQRKTDRQLWIDNGRDPVEFDNHYYQRSYARDETGRPYWFDFTVESIGVLQAADLLQMAVKVLQSKIEEFAKAPILREEPNWYRIEVDGETFTIGQLVQEILYKSGGVDFVSLDMGHPLLPKLIIYFNTKQEPEKVVENFKAGALRLCENVLQSV
jgi:DNA-directed RNA polymerase subunit L